MMTNNFRFHGSTVIGFKICSGEFILELEDVVYQESKIGTHLAVQDISRIMIDSKPVKTVSMVTSDGEILSMDMSESGFSALIEWNDFEASTSVTHSYEVQGSKVNITIAR